MDGFMVAVDAIVPFLIYILFGYAVRRCGFAGEDFLKKLNQLIFRCFFPIMMFTNIYQIDTGTILDKKLIFIGIGSVFFLIAIGWILIPRFVKENAKRGVIIMALFRSNFVLFALPLTLNVFGEEYRVVPVMMIAFVIPVYNVMSVVVLEAFRGGRVKTSVLMKNVCTNPMILGVAAGLAALVIGVRIPVCVMKPMLQFADLCTPLGMFVLGGTLRFDRLFGDIKYIVPILVIRMVIMPILVMGISGILGMGALERFILLTMYATPVATGSYAMAQNMEGDAELAGECIIVSTVFSVVTLFSWIWLLGSIGFLA